jgi:hypothetical protein
MRPDIMSRVADTPGLAPVVAEADERLRRALVRLEG